MILDQNDPTGKGLFSRCARNQACKITNSRPATAGSKKSVTNQLKIQQSKKKNNTRANSFSRQQSRQQRERKYMTESTPAVGQYNTNVKHKPKLIWDVLKIYQKKNREMKKLQELHAKIVQKTTIKQTLHGQQTKSRNQNQQTLQHSMKTAKQLQPSVSPLQSSTPQPGHGHQRTQASLKSQCIVNMSRMTGRSNHTTLDESSRYINKSSQSINLNKSISNVKERLVKNIYFKKMVGRKGFDKGCGVDNVYDCNLSMVRKEIKINSNFAIIKGRETNNKKTHAFSYTHYDFDQYVWRNSSTVYPNTKKNLISFDKQM